MMGFPANMRMFLANQPVDGRKSFNGLAGVVESQFDMQPMSGDVFVFLNKRANLVRMLFWDRDGFCLIAKRLEMGTFRRVRRGAETQAQIEIDAADLALLLEGIEATVIRRGKRYCVDQAA